MDANGEDAMSDANKAVVRKYYELLDAGDIDGLMSILDDDVQWKFHGIGDMTKGSIGGLVQGFAAAFPDMKHTLSEQLAEGSTVVTQLTFNGTHRGDLMGIPGSGKSVEMRTFNIFEVVDGKIKSGETVPDMLGMMQQIGAIPS